MALVEVLYLEIYEKLKEYSSRLRQSRFKMEAAFSAYEAKCAANDRQLKAALNENMHKQTRLEAELALSGVNTNDIGTNEKLIALKKEAEELKVRHAAHRQELDREFKTTENRLINENGKLKAVVKEYICSTELKSFAFIVNSDRALYDNAAAHKADSLSGTDYISIGTLRALIPVHEEYQTDIMLLFNRNYDIATKTIALPACIDIKKGQSIVVEYRNTTEQEMLAGIRNFVLNTSRYWGDGLAGKRELLLFQNFPEAYDIKEINNIRSLCVDAADSGNIIILTHNSVVKNVDAADTFTFIKSISMNIESGVGGFFMEMSKKKDIAGFKWYSSVENAGDRHEEDEVDVSAQNMAVYIEDREILHNIITTIVKNMHPDDVELWLIDFGRFEFRRYVKCMPPHVRYLICEELEELVYDILDRLIEVFNKRQDIFKEKGWRVYDDISSEKYMPLVIVMVNELAVMSEALYVSEVYAAKLKLLFEEGEGLGFRFILSGDRRLEEYKGFEEELKKYIWQYNSGKVLLKDVFLSPLCIMDREEQAEFIDLTKERLSESLVYNAEDSTVYIDKKAVVIDGSRYTAFENSKEFMAEYIAGQYTNDSGTKLLFLGEARRMSAIHPVSVEREAFENMVIIAPEAEKKPAAAVALSVLESLKLQNVKCEIWGSVRSSIFKVLKNCVQQDVFTAGDIESIREQIRAVKKDIMAQKKIDRFVILMGFEALLNTSGNVYPGIYDLSADIRFILTYGPQLGYHFVVVFSLEAEFERSRIPESIFRHKIVFGAKEHSFRYSNEKGGVIFKPYLFEDLSWDGWSFKNGEVSHVFGQDEYLL